MSLASEAWYTKTHRAPRGCSAPPTFSEFRPIGGSGGALDLDGYVTTAPVPDVLGVGVGGKARQRVQVASLAQISICGGGGCC